MTPPESWPAGIDYDETRRVVHAAMFDAANGQQRSPNLARVALDAIASLIAKAVEEAERPCEHCDRYNEDGATPMAWCACPDCWEGLAAKWKEAEQGREAAVALVAQADAEVANLSQRCAEAEVDADRLAETGDHMHGCLSAFAMPAPCDCGWDDARAAHEARKAASR